MTKIIKTPVGRLVFNNPHLRQRGDYGKLTAKQYTIDDSAAITEAARVVFREMVKEMAFDMARVVMINAASEKAASCAASAMQWRDMTNPASNPDRNQTRSLIAAAFQRDAAQYYKLAIDLRLTLP